MHQIKADCLYFVTFPKPGENLTNCQDVCSINKEKERFSIADGVTQSFLAADWAKLLVNSFSESNDEALEKLFIIKNWREWLFPIQKQWEEQTREKVSKLTGNKFVFTRNRFAKREQAAATFIGLRKKENTDGKIWQAMIIGDSCLFHITKDNKVSTYPLSSSTEFNSHPPVFASYHDKSYDEPIFLEIQVESGDYLFLCTDALSKLLITYKENNENVFYEILERLLQGNYLDQHLEFHRSNLDFPLESDDIGIIAIIFNTNDHADNNIERESVSLSNLGTTTVYEVNKYNTAKPINILQVDKKTEDISKSNKKIISPAIRWIIFGALFIAIPSLVFYLYLNKIKHTQYTISANSNIILTPEHKIVLFSSIRDFDVNVLEKNVEFNGEVWSKIEFSAWFVCPPLPDGKGIIQTGTSVYTTLSPETDSIGVIPPNIPLVIDEQSVLDNTIWCRTLVQGYISEDIGE